MTLRLDHATLYDFPYSSSCYRLRIALNIKGLAPASVRPVDLRAGAHLARDYLEMAGAPVLPAVDFGGVAFTQSLALIEWLDTAHPAPRLIPEDPTDALAVRSMAATIACDIHPLNTPRVLKRLTGPMGLSEDDRQDWYAHWVREGFGALERQLAAHESRGPFCLGTTPTLADVVLAPQVLNARRFGVDVSDFRRIGDVYDRCMAEPAFRNAAPEPDEKSKSGRQS